MNYSIKEKKWYWLGFNKTFTTIGHTIYCPKGKQPTQDIIDHETIHMVQQEQYGLAKYIFLYILCAPLFYNKWRYKWELEAYVNGSKITKEEANIILGSGTYGWLKNKE